MTKLSEWGAMLGNSARYFAPFYYCLSWVSHGSGFVLLAEPWGVDFQYAMVWVEGCAMCLGVTVSSSFQSRSPLRLLRPAATGVTADGEAGIRPACTSPPRLSGLVVQGFGPCRPHGTALT